MPTNDALLSMLHWLLLTLIVYSGLVGLGAMLIPEHTSIHRWIERYLLNSAVAVAALVAAVACWAGAIGAVVLLHMLLTGGLG